MFRQSMAIDHRSGSHHHALKLEKDTLMAEPFRRRKVPAINPNAPPISGMPALPGKFRNAMRQRDLCKVAIVELRLYGIVAESPSEEPVPIQGKQEAGRTCAGVGLGIRRTRE